MKCLQTPIQVLDYGAYLAKFFKMSASLSRKSEGFCSSCKRVTVYDCLKCKIKICNECSTFEENENVEGWRMGKAVGHCEGCFLAKSDSEDESTIVKLAMKV